MVIPCNGPFDQPPFVFFPHGEGCTSWGLALKEVTLYELVKSWYLKLNVVPFLAGCCFLPFRTSTP